VKLVTDELAGLMKDEELEQRGIKATLYHSEHIYLDIMTVPRHGAISK
jgi:hypothetical protein